VESGRISTISSVIRPRPATWTGELAASKAGSVRFHQEPRPSRWARRGITSTRSSRFHRNGEVGQIPKAALECRDPKRSHRGGLGRPEEVARVVRFLLEDESAISRGCLHDQRRPRHVMADDTTDRSVERRRRISSRAQRETGEPFTAPAGRRRQDLEPVPEPDRARHSQASGRRAQEPCLGAQDFGRDDVCPGRVLGRGRKRAHAPRHGRGGRSGSTRP